MESTKAETRPEVVAAMFIREVIEEFPSTQIGYVLNAGIGGERDELETLYKQRGRKLSESKKAQILSACDEVVIAYDPLMYLHPILEESPFAHFFEPSVTHTGSSDIWRWFVREYPHLESHGKIIFYSLMWKTFGMGISQIGGRAVDTGYFQSSKPCKTIPK